MKASPIRTVAAGLLVCLFARGTACPSAYNARPKLVVVIVIDQFRGDYLERYRDQFGEGGFRLFLDHGAYFPNCDYEYANTRTAPGHSTLFTGTYTSGHGIISNEWWDPEKKRQVSSVEDEATKLIGTADTGPGASPHNLMASTLGDELKLATQGRAHVFGISLKDRAAVLPAGFAADGAYWIDKDTGAWITSTYYRSHLPNWVQQFNQTKRAEKYLNREWKDDKGNVLGTTESRQYQDYFGLVGATPFGNDYELEFARELVLNEHLGSGPATDLLSISLSANDILGHQVGPDAPQMQAMALALDRQLRDFFNFLGRQLGLGNVWIALSADHGVAPLPAQASKLHIPAAGLNAKKLRDQVNDRVNDRIPSGHRADYVKEFDYPLAWLDQDAFSHLPLTEEAAENAVGQALEDVGLRGYYTRSQLARGAVPDTAMGRKFLNSYSPEGGWYVMAVPTPYTVGSTSGTDHASPYSYDTHVPLAFYGPAFHPGTYRRHAEPVDLAVTLASLLGVNAPSNATGRVLTEAVSNADAPFGSQEGQGPSNSQHLQPASRDLPRGDD